MKKILLLVTLNFMIIHSCTKMDSVHERYLDGEIIYSGKLDSLQVRSGYYRVQVDGQTRFLGNSKKVFVEFEDRKESFKALITSAGILIFGRNCRQLHCL